MRISQKQDVNGPLAPVVAPILAIVAWAVFILPVSSMDNTLSLDKVREGCSQS